MNSSMRSRRRLRRKSKKACSWRKTASRFMSIMPGREDGSTVGYVDRTLRFALRQPDTPRRNGLLAYTYNCQGINYHNFHRKADEVVSLYQSAYAYSMRSDVQHQAPSICANLGDAYLFKNQLPQAASWYRRALFLVDSLQLPPPMWVWLPSI